MPHLGQVEYAILSDGVTYVDGGGAFGLVPRRIWQKLMAPDDQNLIPMTLNCLLLRSEGKTILVDTGFGPDVPDRLAKIYGLQRPEGDLIQGLKRLGVSPQEIDIVIDTHLHADHCGGNTRRQGENWVATYPNAEYWVQRSELADATYPNERTRNTYFSQFFLPLQQTGHLRIVDGDTVVTSQIKTVMMPGHTRGQQGVLIESGGQYGLFVADMASFSYHFERTAWVTAYDVEPLVTIETKRHWQRWAVQTGATIFFQHDPNVRTARLFADGDRFRLEPTG
ncbi:MAG: MBL fold metallo-hydrolase [Anaerolineae bacterium]